MKQAELDSLAVKADVPQVRPGDTVKVSCKIKEGDQERIQGFQGVVLKEGGRGVRASITIRRVSSGVGVERTFLLHSPMVQSVEVLRHGRIRRARLFYLRPLSAKAARIKERRPATPAA